MKHLRLFIITAILIMSILWTGAGAEVFAKGARAENAEQRIYTPYELCCMAQYYYKRTNNSTSSPAEAECLEQKDGTYAITLRTKVIDQAAGQAGTAAQEEKFHYTIYAQYTLNANAQGTDTAGKSIDLTLYSKVYTPAELCKLAQDYFFRVNDFYPPNAEAAANKDGTYTISLFESIEDADGTEHSATCGWYTVNVCGVGTDDLMMQDIDINP